MLVACREAGFPEPVIEYETSGLWVTFPFSEEFVARTAGDAAREKILRLITDNPHVSTADLARELGITRKGMEWHINRMKKDGLLKRLGADRGGHWEVLT
jgi:ATP-dependent DNA helicase RecG